MKLPFHSALAAGMLALAALPVQATELDDRVSQLKHAIEKEAAAKAADNAGPQGGFRNQGISPAMINASLDQMLAGLDSSANLDNVNAELAQITTIFTSAEVQETTTNLLAVIHKERKDRAEAEAADAKALVQRAADKVNQAKKPEDLDDLIVELQKHENNRFGDNAQNQALNAQVRAALEFTMRWQDYLAHLAGGQTEQARQDIQNLAANNSGVNFIPRSKLLALEATPLKVEADTNKPEPPPPVSPVKAILDNIKTVDDLAPALARLEPLRNANYDGQNAFNSVEQLLQAYRDLKAGLPTQYNLGNGGSNSLVPAPVRTQFLLLALQTRFESYKGAAPAPTEKPVDYVNRVSADAIEREDWPLLQDAVHARSYLSQSSGMGFTFTNGSGISSLITASHQEAAGQFTLAVASYEAALTSNDDAVPAKVIGDKLAAIQREHPKEYADGMQLTVSPPGPRSYEMPEPGLPKGANLPGRWPAGNPTAPIPPTLLSPPANTNTDAAPAAK
jgi:hypothetical protein